MSWPLSRSFFLLCWQKGYFHLFHLTVGILSLLIFILSCCLPRFVLLTCWIEDNTISQNFEKKTSILYQSHILFRPWIFYVVKMPLCFEFRLKSVARTLWRSASSPTRTWPTTRQFKSVVKHLSEIVMSPVTIFSHLSEFFKFFGTF